MRLANLLLVLLLAAPLVEGQPKNGYVPDAATAVKIAEAVLSPIYGEKRIQDERPFQATLKDNVWTVDGTLQCDDAITAHCRGGTAEIQISKADARVLSVTHGR